MQPELLNPMLADEFEGITLPTARMAEYLQAMQLKRFGGSSGLRDRSLLEGAIVEGASAALYSDGPDAITAACSMAMSLIRNRPFTDGNKRASFAILTSTLAVNGYRFDMDPAEAAHLVNNYAARRISSDEFQSAIGLHCRPDDTHRFEGEPFSCDDKENGPPHPDL